MQTIAICSWPHSATMTDQAALFAVSETDIPESAGAWEPVGAQTEEEHNSFMLSKALAEHGAMVAGQWHWVAGGSNLFNSFKGSVTQLLIGSLTPAMKVAHPHLAHCIENFRIERIYVEVPQRQDMDCVIYSGDKVRNTMHSLVPWDEVFKSDSKTTYVLESNKIYKVLGSKQWQGKMRYLLEMQPKDDEMYECCNTHEYDRHCHGIETFPFHYIELTKLGPQEIGFNLMHLHRTPGLNFFHLSLCPCPALNMPRWQDSGGIIFTYNDQTLGDKNGLGKEVKRWVSAYRVTLEKYVKGNAQLGSLITKLWSVSKWPSDRQQVENQQLQTPAMFVTNPDNDEEVAMEDHYKIWFSRSANTTLIATKTTKADDQGNRIYSPPEYMCNFEFKELMYKAVPQSGL